MVAANDPKGHAGHEREQRVHTPVLLKETIKYILGGRDAATLKGWIIDGTLGAGGHARAILEALPMVRLFGIDQDPEAIALAREELSEFGERVVIVNTRISKMCAAAGAAGVESALAVLFDLGANSLHFDRPERGFSFAADGPLDMRMDPSRRRTAAEIINKWDEADLADLFYYEGGEHRSRRIAASIVEARRRVPFLRTLSLADVVATAVGGKSGKTHPATKVFQALRRAVNEEGLQLERGLAIAEHVLVDDGRLVVLTFHSGEDGVVKRHLQKRAKEGCWEVLTKKALGPDYGERRQNPRSRSARLRSARRVRSSNEAGGPA